MEEKRDYYEVLGVPRDADEDTIRRAYKKLAVKYHPDRNPGDAKAEASFKEATEAYSVLSDGDKRGAYDRFGHAGVNGRGVDFGQADFGDIFSHFQDVFSDFFGGFGGAGPGRRRGPARGDDIRVDARLTFAEAYEGTKKEVNVSGTAPCDNCGGSGAASPSDVQTCGTCGGAGQVTTRRGFVMFSTTCPTCRGRGRSVTKACEACSGVGVVEKHRTVLVTFPAGIDSGQRLRVTGQGMPGPEGAPPGDLYVDVELERNANFEREGHDLIRREDLTFVEAALGTELEVELPDGRGVDVKVKGGTQPGTVLTVRGKGFPTVDRRGRGDLHVVVNVEVPTKLSKKAKKLLGELDAELSR